MKLETLGDPIINVNTKKWFRTTDIIFQDGLSCRKPFFNLDHDLVKLDVMDRVVDRVELSGRSVTNQPQIIDKDIKDTLFSKDIVKVSLGNKDTLVVKEFESDRKSTQIDVLLGKGNQTVNISDMDLRRKGNRESTSSSNIGDVNQYFRNISTINIHNVEKQDTIEFNDKDQDLRFVQGASGVRVDVIEQGGSFKDPEDYLGRLFFKGADVTTVQNAFKPEMLICL